MTILSGAKKFWEHEEEVDALYHHFLDTARDLKDDLDKLGVEIDGKSVLDLGCGTGRILAIYKPKNYVGVDQSSQMLFVAQKNYPLAQWKQSDILKYRTTRRFDVVLLLNVLQHVQNPDVYIRYMLKHFNANTYAIRMFAADEQIEVDSKFGPTSIAYPVKYIEDLIAIFEQNNFETSTMLGASVTDDISQYYIVARRKENQEKAEGEETVVAEESVPDTATKKVSQRRRGASKTYRNAK